MFLTNRKSVAWRWIAGALLVGLVASYAWYARGVEGDRLEMGGGTAWGIGYGVAAVALVLLLAAFGWRKRAYRSKVGTLEGWLQAHVYLGVLVVVVALLHSGFRFQDKVAVAALVTMAGVVLSGLVGAACYTVYPRLLTEVQSNLSPAEVSERLNRLTASMARLVAGRSRAFEGVYREVVASSVPRGLAGWKLLLGRMPGDVEGWSRLLGRVPPEEQEPLRQLLMLARQHRELHLRLAHQERYKNLLDVWLWVHVPLTVLLLVLIAVHIVGAFYFGAV